MPKKHIIFAALAVVLTAAPLVVAQTRTAEDGEALQRELERKAVHIPAREAARAAAGIASPRREPPRPRGAGRSRSGAVTSLDSRPSRYSRQSQNIRYAECLHGDRRHRRRGVVLHDGYMQQGHRRRPGRRRLPQASCRSAAAAARHRRGISHQPQRLWRRFELFEIRLRLRHDHRMRRPKRGCALHC